MQQSRSAVCNVISAHPLEYLIFSAIFRRRGSDKLRRLRFSCSFAKRGNSYLNLSQRKIAAELSRPLYRPSKPGRRIRWLLSGGEGFELFTKAPHSGGADLIYVRQDKMTSFFNSNWYTQTRTDNGTQTRRARGSSVPILDFRTITILPFTLNTSVLNIFLRTVGKACLDLTLPSATGIVTKKPFAESRSLAVGSSNEPVDLLVTLSTLLRGSIYEKLRWAFKLYDINGDGCITRSELGEIVVAVHELMGKRTNHFKFSSRIDILIKDRNFQQKLTFLSKLTFSFLNENVLKNGHISEEGEEEVE
ncbi:unnamed protein product [Nesidiocoris tenuis]|uniref:EF-hand domain-containing protein n=1 Tax=Nesidiocoris tenuis TaxID=355587 RepID=A0A6H5GDB3_9HEMI|nr:unnamed protein product [Nesidiocoris tenuis]